MAGKVFDNDKGWKRIVAAANAAAGRRYVKVGVLGTKADEKEGDEGGPLTVAEIAAVHEFGTEDGRIPERSFLRSTFDEHKDELERMAVDLLPQVVLFGLHPDKALGILGLKLSSEVKKKITSGAGIPPPNAPATLMAKAGTGKTGRFFKGQATSLGQAFAQVGALAAVRTLVDTGRMLGAITWAIVDKDE